MRINIGRKNLSLQNPFVVSPNVGKLERELSEFFSKNKIEGIEIKEFKLFNNSNCVISIVPEAPYFEEELSGEGDYRERIIEIGKKYGLKYLGFMSWCYHK